MQRLVLPSVSLAVLGACLADPDPPSARGESALAHFVGTSDPAYRFELARVLEEPGEGCRSAALELVSQAWREPGDADRTEWTHRVWIVVPPGAAGATALLWIGGGETGDAPDAPPAEMLYLAQASGCVVAYLSNVPNQPLALGGDGVHRYEDDLVARSWVLFLETGDPEWAIRLPMVKSAVRAMDAVQEFLSGESALAPAPARFVVAGASKRGWTAWLTGAVDPRVVGIAPHVIDVLDVVESMRHHLAAYGFWAPAVGDYVRHGIPERMHEPRFAELMELEDPFAHRHRLRMAKYVVCASGDQFFLPDSSRFYWDELPPGPNLLRYVPNADHSLAGTDAVQALAAWTRRVALDEPLPAVTSGVEAGDGLWLRTDTRPFRAQLWRAVNPLARDFRLEELGAAWEQVPVEESEPGVYRAPLSAPARGYSAAFLELSFGTPELPLVVTSQVHVRPDTLPHLEELHALERASPQPAAASDGDSAARPARGAGRH